MSGIGRGELDARLAEFLPRVARGFERAGKLGHGPGQVPRETLEAVGRRLRLEDLRDAHRAVYELGHAFTVASSVLAPQVSFRGAMRDPFVAEVLLHVARLTAAGQLEEGARVIDEAIARVQHGDSPSPGALKRLAQAFSGRPTRHSELLLAQMRQRTMLRDAQGVADSLLARAALFHPDRPAWNQRFGHQMTLMAEDGTNDDINFLLHVAAAMARHGLESALTPDERGLAWTALAAPLITLADREPGPASLQAVLQALRQAVAECKATGQTQDLPLLEASLAEFSKRQPGPGEPPPHPIQAPAVQAPQAAPESRAARHFDVPAQAPRQAQPSVAPTQRPAPPTAPATEPREAQEARIQRVFADLHAQGHIGTGPRQVPPACALSLVRALTPHDLADPVRTACELTFSVSGAIGVLQRGNDDSPDPKLDATLRRVATLTADGQLQQAALAIDEVVVETEANKAQLDAQSYRNRRQGLLEASVRQADLLRDAKRAADAIEAQVALSGVDRPASSTPFRTHFNALYMQYLDKGYVHPLEVAIKMAELRYEAALTPREQGEAMLLLGKIQGARGEHARSTVQVNQGLHTLHRACEAFASQSLQSDWGEAKLHWSIALMTLGKLERDKPHLAHAESGLREAIQALELANDHTPARWGVAQFHLGQVLLVQDEREGGIARLREAIQAFQNALQVITQELAPEQFAETRHGLLAAERLLKKRSTAATPTQPPSRAARFIEVPPPPATEPGPAAPAAPAASPSLTELARQAQTLAGEAPSSRGATPRTLLWVVSGIAVLVAGMMVVARRGPSDNAPAASPVASTAPSPMPPLDKVLDAAPPPAPGLAPKPMPEAQPNPAAQEQRIPDMALIDSDCKRGFRHVGSACELVEVPANGRLDKSGHDWECKPGYRPAGNECAKPTSAARAPTEALTQAERERQGAEAQPKPKDEITARLDALHRDWRSIEASPGYFYYRAKTAGAAQGAWLDSPGATEAAQALLQYAQWAVPGTTLASLPGLSTEQLSRGRLKPLGRVTHVNRRLAFFIADFSSAPPPAEVLVRDDRSNTWHVLTAAKTEGTQASFSLPGQMQSAAIDEKTQLYAMEGG